jgi:hypothetical protein
MRFAQARTVRPAVFCCILISNSQVDNAMMPESNQFGDEAEEQVSEEVGEQVSEEVGEQ